MGYGWMLNRGGDDVSSAILPRTRRALDDVVVGLRSARRKNDLIRRRSEHVSHLLSGALDSLLARPTHAVAAGWIAKVLLQIGQHRLTHGWVDRSGCVIVQIDHGSAPLGVESGRVQPPIATSYFHILPRPPTLHEPQRERLSEPRP